MDAFGEDSLVRLMVSLLEDIHYRCDAAKSDAMKLEMGLHRLLKRLDKRIPAGIIWPSEKS